MSFSDTAQLDALRGLPDQIVQAARKEPDHECFRPETRGIKFVAARMKGGSNRPRFSCAQEKTDDLVITGPLDSLVYGHKLLTIGYA